MEGEAIPFLDELRCQIVVAAREGRDRQARTPRAWMSRHALLLAIVAGLVLTSGTGAALLSRPPGNSTGGQSAGAQHGVAAPAHVLKVAPARSVLGARPTPGVGDQLYSIAAAGPNDVWAVGDRLNGTAPDHSLIEHWDGHEWSVVSCPNIGWLVSVTAVTTKDVWAIAQGTGLGRQALHWDGSTWQVVTGASLLRSRGSGRVTLISGHSSADVWAIGWGRAGDDAKWGPLAMRWDGVSWKRVPSPGVLAKKHHSTPVSLAVLGPSDVWAVGSRTIVLRSSHHKARRPFLEHWNGNVWSVVAAPSILAGGTELAQIATTPDGELWAVGSAYTRPIMEPSSQARPVVMHRNGNAWKILRLPSAFDAALTCVGALSRRDVWVGGSSGPDLGHWSGFSWRVFHRTDLGLAGEGAPGHVEAIAAAATDDVWAVAYDSRYTTLPDGSSVHIPLILHWDGTHWRRSAAASYQQP